MIFNLNIVNLTTVFQIEVIYIYILMIFNLNIVNLTTVITS